VLAESWIGANVPVSDVGEAIAYYEGRLGLTLRERRAAWLKDLGGNILEITGA
jgi:hypothetical protein